MKLILTEKYTRGTNPKSRQNLSARTPIYGAGNKKKVREVTVTDEAWLRLKQMAKHIGCSGVSEILEKLGRDELKLQLEPSEAERVVESPQSEREQP